MLNGGRQTKKGEVFMNLNLLTNPCATLWTFLSILVFFLYIILPVFMLTAYILAQVCIFIGTLIFQPHFL